jgi:hypothetical protein
LVLVQPRFPHPLQEALHQFGRLIGDAGPEPVERELRLLAPYHDKEFTGFIDSPNLGKACAAQTLRSVKARTRGAGREIVVGHMRGRSRAYMLPAHSPGKTAISVAFNDRCDMVVATAVLPHDRPAAIEPGIIAFLNSGTVLRWAEATLGL